MHKARKNKLMPPNHPFNADGPRAARGLNGTLGTLREAVLYCRLTVGDLHGLEAAHNR